MQRVIDLPELKMIKPSDTHWLSCEQCVKAVKESYSALVYAFNNIYEESHEPEAQKLVQTFYSIAAIHLHDHNFPLLACSEGKQIKENFH